MNIQWSRRRKVSLAMHVIYLSITFFSGLGASLVLWQSWFSALEKSWLAAALVVGTLEILAVTSLVLHIARIEWPLASLRNVLPFFSIVPLGYELFLLLESNGWGLAATIASLLTGWFVFLSFKLLHSLEGLFIDSVEAAREQAKEEMGRVATALARFQETKRAAEEFAMSILPPTPQPRPFVPAPLLLNESATLQLTDSADPRFADIMKLASMKDGSGAWMHSPDHIQTVTRAAPELISVVCRIVRSGQVVIT